MNSERQEGRGEKGYTFRDISGAILRIIKKETGKEPKHPLYDKLGFQYAGSYIFDQVRDARERARENAGDYWSETRLREKTGPVIFDDLHVSAILDEIAEASETDDIRGMNLRKVLVTPEILKRVEEVLLGIEQE